jgi:hypothetical protein
VIKDERFSVLCGVYKELNLAAKKKMEKIAVKLLCCQMAAETEKLLRVENREDRKRS